MTRTAKQAEAERVSRTRAAMRAQALLMGWTPLDALGSYVTPDGHVVIVLRDGGRIEAELSASLPVARVENVPVALPKRVYAPKAWQASAWNRNRAQIIEAEATKASVIEQLTTALSADPSELHTKQLKQAVAVIEALPDSPDWYIHLPEAPETEG